MHKLRNLYMDGVMREVSAQVKGKGVRLEHKRERCMLMTLFPWWMQLTVYKDLITVLKEKTKSKCIQK